MSWQRLLEPEIKAFIDEHQDDDVSALALKKPPQQDWPYKLILDQIKSRQKAQHKIPSWLKPGIVLPAPDVIEQCSSDATAAYKASLAQGDLFVDLTGGAGVDTCAFGKNFKRGICIERDERTAQMLAHNLPLVSSTPIKVLQQNAEDFVADMLAADFVFIDPQRRDSAQKGKYRLEDCSPNILSLLPNLKAERVLLKTSPMLDIDAGIEALGCVESVHVVEWRGECKELLFMLQPGHKAVSSEVPINAIQIDDEGFPVSGFSFTRADEDGAIVEYALPGQFLYEPGPAFQKAGGFGAMAEFYGLRKLHKHTHLYTSDIKIDIFPGRAFKIFDMVGAGAKALPVTKANLTLRNFPGTPDALRKKLGLADGGDTTIFACTLMDERKALVLCQKI